jgi:hypothetical protein
MNNSNLNVTEKCIQCGSCLGSGFDFLGSASDGSIIVCAGTVLSEQSQEYKALKDICPVGAFEIDTTVKQSDKKQIINNMIEELKNYEGVSIPTYKDIKFHRNEYSVSLPSASGEYRYEYSSYSEAERAALREFERTMYSQIDNIILKIITEYRVIHVKPYYTAEIKEGSVYAKSNQKVSEMLSAIKNVVNDNLPNDFARVDLMPDRETVWKMLNKGELVSGELISSVRSKFDYSASQYACYCDTDDMEVASGTDWHGNTKYKDKYCYRNMRAAFQELEKDLLNACDYAEDSIEECTLNHIKWLVEVYNKDLRDLIDKKVKQIEQINK